MTSRTEKSVTGGGATVFADLCIDLSPTDLLKANLAAFVSRILQDNGLSQAEAAKALGIDQPKVSKLLRGRLQEFSVERLIGFVLALGHKVDVTIGSTAKVRRRVELAA